MSSAFIRDLIEQFESSVRSDTKSDPRYKHLTEYNYLESKLALWKEIKKTINNEGLQAVKPLDGH